MKTDRPLAEAPGALPFIGHAIPLVRDPLRLLRTLPAHGDLVRIRIGLFPAIVVCDPHLVHRVLTDDLTFDKGGPLFDRVAATVGRGLITCSHLQHRRQRRLTQPAFHRSRFPAYTRIMVEQIAGAIDGWNDGQTIDVLAEMQKITMRVVLATMFSTSLSTAAIARATRDLHDILSLTYWRMFLPALLRRLPTAANLRYERANAGLRHTVAKAVTERRSEDLIGSKGDDLLTIWLAERDDETDGRGFSDAELVDQIMTFFIAGVETTANVLSWALSFLSDDAEAERRLHAEVDGVFRGRPAHHDLPLAQLPFTGQIVTETLRICPPGWMFTRITRTATRLAGQSFPAGTTLIYSPYLLHHRADLHPDPERFDPDRWTESGDAPIREAFIPFGGGGRKCIGDDFGVTEACSALAMIASRWRLRRMADGACEAEPRLGLRPKDLHMRVTARFDP
ncbi:cytochrome P450 [Nonomuraea sp. NPDC050404]|uniref:cytochrome P450 n=1 Tax=Nonomuraea sp. NPDC050404 TaxID=3155783 RepID=UPI0033C91158